MDLCCKDTNHLEGLHHHLPGDPHHNTASVAVYTNIQTKTFLYSEVRKEEKNQAVFIVLRTI